MIPALRQAVTPAVALAVLLLLLGCADDEVAPELQVNAKKSAPVEQINTDENTDANEEDVSALSLPQYFYTGAAGRDPFLPFFSKKPIVQSGVNKDRAEAASRGPKGPLERFDLSTLKLVAVIGRQSHRMALIRDISGKSYQISVGNLIGLNEGKVVRIDDDKLIILEPYVDQFGQRQERLITKEIREN